MTCNMTRAELVERIMWLVDGYRFGGWSIVETGARIAGLIEANSQAIEVSNRHFQASREIPPWPHDT